MTLSEAVRIVEEEENPDVEDYQKAWQYLIDTGTCWQFQGWYGRTAVRLIEEGFCTPPKNENETKDTTKDPEYCDACECTPCDCSWGLY